jgi:hypothetical protein
MDKYKPGDIFISKLTGKKVIVISDDERDATCQQCIYIRYCRSHDDKELRLRLMEGGSCTRGERSNGKGVIFREIKQLYMISKETISFLEEIKNDPALKEDEKLNYQFLLLNAEFDKYINNEGDYSNLSLNSI